MQENLFSQGRANASVNRNWSAWECALREQMERGQAVVVSVRKNGPHENLIRWAQTCGRYTYVGRANKWTGHRQSIWHNPYRSSDTTDAILSFTRHIYTKPALYKRLPEIQGHALGCWCKELPTCECHGDVLAQLANHYHETPTHGITCKALSVRQPWAWLIVCGGKDVENRGWEMKYRGPLLIHAAQGCHPDEWDSADLFCQLRDLPRPPQRHELHKGGIVGAALVVGCNQASGSPWHMEDCWGIHLSQQEPIPFFPCRGKLGLFDVMLP